MIGRPVEVLIVPLNGDDLNRGEAVDFLAVTFTTVADENALD